MAKPYKWTIEIEIDPVWVADGFEPDDDWVCDMLMRELSSATGDEVRGRIIARPDKARILREQGYSKADIAAAVAQKSPAACPFQALRPTLPTT